MCKSVFKNQEEQKRKEDFSKLFAVLVSINAAQQMDSRKKKKVC